MLIPHDPLQASARLHKPPQPSTSLRNPLQSTTTNLLYHIVSASSVPCKFPYNMGWDYSKVAIQNELNSQEIQTRILSLSPCNPPACPPIFSLVPASHPSPINLTSLIAPLYSLDITPLRNSPALHHHPVLSWGVTTCLTPLVKACVRQVVLDKWFPLLGPYAFLGSVFCAPKRRLLGNLLSYTPLQAQPTIIY